MLLDSVTVKDMLPGIWSDRKLKLQNLSFSPRLGFCGLTLQNVEPIFNLSIERFQRLGGVLPLGSALSSCRLNTYPEFPKLKKTIWPIKKSVKLVPKMTEFPKKQLINRALTYVNSVVFWQTFGRIRPRQLELNAPSTWAWLGSYRAVSYPLLAVR